MHAEPPAVGYVLKMYPRYSETFVVSEILAREAAGERVVIFSLRPPSDPRFHAELARVQAPVIQIGRPTKVLGAWALLRAAWDAPGLDVAPHLEELVEAPPDDALQALALALAARDHGVDHLHSHFASVATTVARLAALLTGLPYSFTAHAKDIFHSEVDAADLGRKLSDAHHVVTVSDFNVRYLAERFPEALTRLHRVYNGLELDRFRFEPRTVRPSGSGSFRVCAVGRLVEKKGFFLLLEAASVLNTQGIDLVVDLAGDGPLREELESGIDRLGLTDVFRLHGPLAQDEIAALLRRADVFAAPCVVAADGNADGLPTVLLEAMAAGVPCIASDVTGIPEVVHDGRTGLLVRAGSLEDLVRGLRTVNSPVFDPEPLAMAARRLVEEQFDSARQARELGALRRGVPVQERRMEVDA